MTPTSMPTSTPIHSGDGWEWRLADDPLHSDSDAPPVPLLNDRMVPPLLVRTHALDNARVRLPEAGIVIPKGDADLRAWLAREYSQAYAGYRTDTGTWRLVTPQTTLYVTPATGPDALPGEWAIVTCTANHNQQVHYGPYTVAQSGALDESVSEDDPMATLTATAAAKRHAIIGFGFPNEKKSWYFIRQQLQHSGERAEAATLPDGRVFYTTPRAIFLTRKIRGAVQVLDVWPIEEAEHVLPAPDTTSDPTATAAPTAAPFVLPSTLAELEALSPAEFAQVPNEVVAHLLETPHETPHEAPDEAPASTTSTAPIPLRPRRWLHTVPSPAASPAAPAPEPEPEESFIYHNDTFVAEHIYQFLRRQPDSVRFVAIATRLSRDGVGGNQVRRVVKTLVNDGLLTKVSYGRYQLPDWTPPAPPSAAAVLEKAVPMATLTPIAEVPEPESVVSTAPGSDVNKSDAYFRALSEQFALRQWKRCARCWSKYGNEMACWHPLTEYHHSKNRTQAWCKACMSSYRTPRELPLRFPPPAYYQPNGRRANTPVPTHAPTVTPAPAPVKPVPTPMAVTVPPVPTPLPLPTPSGADQPTLGYFIDHVRDQPATCVVTPPSDPAFSVLALPPRTPEGAPRYYICGLHNRRLVGRELDKDLLIMAVEMATGRGVDDLAVTLYLD